MIFQSECKLSSQLCNPPSHSGELNMQRRDLSFVYMYYNLHAEKLPLEL